MSWRSTEFDAVARCVGHVDDSRETANWYVYWWRRDGVAHGSRGTDMTLPAAMAFARDIREGRVRP